MRSHQQLHIPLRKNKGFFVRAPLSKINQSPEIQSKVREALDYINTHYTDYPRLSDASILVGLSPSHLCRQFKQETGINFCEYIHWVRIQRAVFLLLGSRKIIKEITYEIGYSNPQLFSKAFKRCLGCSPKAYRAQHRLAGDRKNKPPNWIFQVGKLELGGIGVKP